MSGFYFEQVLQTALQGIDNQNITAAVLQIGGAILLLSLLYSAYQAFTAGGDVRMLAVSATSYLVLGLVFLNYGQVFRDVTGMFSSVADFIYNLSGVGDLFNQWLNDLSTYADGNIWQGLWGLVTGGIPGFLSTLLIIVAFIIFPLSYTLFTLFYALYGSVLYVTGPFVLALLPATRGMGQLARTYLINLMIFGAWSIIYALIQVLMTAINMDSLNGVLNSNGILNGFLGSGQMVLLAIASILFSISIAFIPYIASRIVRGDVGSTLFALGGAAMTVASTAAAVAGKAFTSGGAGFGSATRASDGPPPPPPPPSSSVVSGSGAIAVGDYSSAPRPLASEMPMSAASSVGGQPPSPVRPQRGSTRPGQPQPFSFTDYAFWWGGYGLGKLAGTRRKE